LLIFCSFNFPNKQIANKYFWQNCLLLNSSKRKIILNDEAFIRQKMWMRIDGGGSGEN